MVTGCDVLAGHQGKSGPGLVETQGWQKRFSQQLTPLQLTQETFTDNRSCVRHKHIPSIQHTTLWNTAAWHTCQPGSDPARSSQKGQSQQPRFEANTVHDFDAKQEHQTPATSCAHLYLLLCDSKVSSLHPQSPVQHREKQYWKRGSQKRNFQARALQGAQSREW